MSLGLELFCHLPPAGSCSLQSWCVPGRVAHAGLLLGNRRTIPPWPAGDSTPPFNFGTVSRSTTLMQPTSRTYLTLLTGSFIVKIPDGRTIVYAIVGIASASAGYLFGSPSILGREPWKLRCLIDGMA